VPLQGALYIEDFRRLCAETARAHSAPLAAVSCCAVTLTLQRCCLPQGFADPRIISSAPIAVTDAALADALGEAKFTSITFRLFKLPPGRLETLCEDYGQWVSYKGTVPGAGAAYSLDDHHRFEKA
jgi:hypothetical protein